MASAPTSSGDFAHLRFVRKLTGKAALRGGGKASEQTQHNKSDRVAHSGLLTEATSAAVSQWTALQQERALQGKRFVPAGIPLLLQIDPNLDIDELRSSLGFEIVSEQDDGFVIVASQDLATLLKKISDFTSGTRGSAAVASVHAIYGEGSGERLKRVAEWLHAEWPTIREDGVYIVDVGIECTGTNDIPAPPSIAERGAEESDPKWAKRQAAYQEKLEQWSKKRDAAYVAWDELKSERETAVQDLIETHYGGEVLKILDGKFADAPQDSFTVRIRVSGRGLKDFVQNYPYVFEVVQPDDIDLPQHAAEALDEASADLAVDPPAAHAPAVGVIDSGIQEGHRWLAPAVDTADSICLVPHETTVADLVSPGGHGTRVAGAVLFGETVPRTGSHALPFWIQNARVLNQSGHMPATSSPAVAMRRAILHLRGGARRTRVFNQSINSKAPSRLRLMSAWAAEIDGLSNEHDVLVIQSAGNLSTDSAAASVSNVGPALTSYVQDPGSRIANPGQSLQALTVGSVAYGAYDDPGWHSFARQRGESSRFSRVGAGIWNVIKPEVVEFGGDYLYSPGVPPRVWIPAVGKACYPELLRSTHFPPGPAFERDDVGTSFAAPKVAHIAGHLQSLLPDEPVLLYRALIVQSARWPTWAWKVIEAYRREKSRNQAQRAKIANAVKAAAKKKTAVPDWAAGAVNDDQERALEARITTIIRQLGFGIPSLQRATANSEHRTTLITSGVQALRVGGGDVFEVPVPNAIRAPGNNYDVLVEVTLSYMATPRRTRRTTKRYLSVWLDWVANALGESLPEFEARALVATEDDGGIEQPPATGGKKAKRGPSIPWTLGSQDDHGVVHGMARGGGTVQKDWAIVKLHQLPESFCIAVRAHKGWSLDPDATAHYALAVSFEVLGQEVAIYEEVRTALTEVQLDELPAG